MTLEVGTGDPIKVGTHARLEPPTRKWPLNWAQILMDVSDRCSMCKWASNNWWGIRSIQYIPRPGMMANTI